MKTLTKTIITLSSILAISIVFSILPSLSTVKTAEAYQCGVIRLSSGAFLYIPCETYPPIPFHNDGCPPCTITIDPRGLVENQAIKVQPTPDGSALISIVPSNISTSNVPSMNTMSVNSTNMGK